MTTFNPETGFCELLQAQLPAPALTYLGGPMSGIAEHNYPAFAEATRRMRLAGFAVLSAHEIDHGEKVPGGLTHEQYMKEDLPVLLRCDYAVFLPGSLGSKGARIERYVAEVTGILCFRYVATNGDHFKLVELDTP